MKKMKNYKKKNIRKGVHVIYDNKKVLNQLVQKTYKAIFKLDTKTLSILFFDIYKELLSRNDFNPLDYDEKRFQTLYDDLKEKGVDISCLI